MKKIFRLFLYLTGAFLVLLIAAGIVFKIFVTPEKVKKYLEQVASQKLNRSLVLGDIHVGIQDGISVKNIKLLDRIKKEDLFVAADELKIQLRWLPLLSKKIIVKEIELVHPQFKVVKLNSAGEYNFSDLTSSSSSEPAASSSPSNPLSFLISHVQIHSGNIRYDDLSNPKNSAQLKNLDLSLNGLSLVSPMTIDTSFDLLARGLDLNNKGQVKLNLFSKELVFPKWAISGKEIKANVSGSIKSFSDNPQLDLHLNLQELALTLLDKFGASSASVKTQGTLSGETDVKGSMDQLAFKGNLLLDQVLIEMPEKFIKPASVPSSIQFDINLLKNNDIKINGSKLKIKSIEFDAKGLVANQNDLNLESNDMDIEQLALFVPSIKPYQLKGLAKLQTTFKGTTDVMFLKGSLGIKKLVSDYITSDSATLTWDLNQLTTSLTKLSGSASLRQNNGEILNLKKFVEGSSVAKIFLSPIAVLQKINKAGGKLVSLPSMDKLKYSSIDGDYLFKAGVMDIQRFDLNADVSASAKGTVQLYGNQPLKMTAELKVSSETLRGTVGQLLKSESGQPAIKMKITGTVNDPIVTVDVAQVKDKLIDTLKKSNVGSTLLKQFGLVDEPAKTENSPEGNTQSPATDSAPVSDSKPTEKDLLKGIMKGIFKK